MYSDTITQLGASSSPSTCFTLAGISMLTVSLSGGECVIGRMTTNRGRRLESLAATRQAGRSFP
ncbi:MAG: hypothetical protein TEF_15580 [Rhizobiales bacterium NRL2]|nr:MAG: hypothetical protein TEF_15580 [Rhizobiales bacterium NRL2]